MERERRINSEVDLLILRTNDELLRMCFLELHKTRSAEGMTARRNKTRNAGFSIEVDLTERTAELGVSHFEFKLL